MAKRAHAIEIHVGGRIRFRRLLLGMSQEKLSQLIGVTFQQVQKYEKGTNRIGVGRLYEIAQALGVAVAYFYEGLPTDSAADVGADQSASDETPHFLRTREGVELNRAFLKLRPAARRAIVDLVRTLSGPIDAVPDLAVRCGDRAADRGDGRPDICGGLER